MTDKAEKRDAEIRRAAELAKEQRNTKLLPMKPNSVEIRK